MIKGSSVYLRIIEKSDIEKVRKWRNSPEVYAYHANRDQISEIQQENWFVKISQSPATQIFIICLMNGDELGICQYKNLDQRNRTVEVGIYLAHPDVSPSPSEKWRGVAPLEAFYLLCNYVFGYLNAHKIYGYVMAENIRAIQMNELFGLKIEGQMKKEVFYENAYHDYLRVGALSDEFYNSSGAKMFRSKL